MNQNYLQVVNKKINENIDFNFLVSIKNKLPYWNIYFFVCIAETLIRFINENRIFNSEDDVINSMIINAKYLYESVDISKIFKINN